MEQDAQIPAKKELKQEEPQLPEQDAQTPAKKGEKTDAPSAAGLC